MKRRLMFYLQFLFVASVIAVFIYVLFSFSKFETEIVKSVGNYGFVAIFVLSFLLDAIMQPLGPDIPIIAGILAGFNVYWVVILAGAASILASLAGHFLGRWYSDFGFKKVYSIEAYKKWRRFFNKYGRPAVAIAAVTPVPYVPVCWMSGIFEMKLTQFLIFAIIPRTLRFIGVAYLVVLLS